MYCNLLVKNQPVNSYAVYTLYNRLANLVGVGTKLYRVFNGWPTTFKVGRLVGRKSKDFDFSGAELQVAKQVGLCVLMLAD